MFFGLVALGVAALRGWGRYERAVVRRDAPIATLTQDLTVCLLGVDAQWIVPIDHGIVHAMGTLLRRAVSAEQRPDWPSRCVPIATQLQQRIDATANASETLRGTVRQLHDELVSASTHPMELVALADSNVLATRLAELVVDVRTISLGTREGWSPSPPNADRWGRLAAPALLSLRPIPSEWLHTAPLTGDRFAMFHQRDGSLYVLQVRGGEMQRVTPGGLAMPVGDPRDGALRTESDRGLAWIDTHSPARLVEAPADLSLDGDTRDFTWDLSRTLTHRALLTVDHGSMRLRTAESTASRWSSATAVGIDESTTAAVVAQGPDGWRVSALRTVLDEGVLEQFTVRADGTVSPPLRLLSHMETFDARVRTCAAGEVRYLAVFGPQNLDVLRIVGGAVQTSRAAVAWARDAAPELTCDAGRALVSASPAVQGNNPTLFQFVPEDTGQGAVIEVPAPGPNATVRAVRLVRDGLVALVANDGALRALRYDTRENTARWMPAGLLALASPTERLARSFTHLRAVTDGDALLVQIEGTLTTLPPPSQKPPTNAPPPAGVPYETLVGSADGGRTFWSL